MTKRIRHKANTLAVGLGANIPSWAGPPTETLIKVRPLLEYEIFNWIKSEEQKRDSINAKDLKVSWRWSPLFESDPVGGPDNQPLYINAVLVAEGELLSSIDPCEIKANCLLKRLLLIENHFGRDRSKRDVRWGPRSLDIDLLAWGELQVRNEELTLPHPRFFQRSFVITPLAEILNSTEKAARRIPPQTGWKE